MKYFKISDISRYVELQSRFEYNEYIRPYYQRIVTDLVKAGIVAIYAEHSNGNRYYMSSFNTQKFDSIELFVIARRFGYLPGGYEKKENKESIVAR